MKKTTCKDMGGACDAEIQGATAEEMIEAGKKHIHDAVDAGDEAHKAIVEKMKGMSEADGVKWREDFAKNFDNLQDA